MRVSGFFLPAALIISLLIFSGCEKEHPRDYPRVTTLKVTDITNSGALFHAEVTCPENVSIIDHGFVWSTTKNPDLIDDERVMLGEYSCTGNFESFVSTALTPGVSYYVCAYVKTTDNIIYGQEVSFTSLGSLGPVVDDFDPKSAGWGDTIKITGHNFSYLPYSDVVYIGEVRASPIILCNDSVIVIQLPQGVNQAKNTVSVSILENTSTAPDLLTFIPPAFHGYGPYQGLWGDTLKFYVKGQINFLLNPNDGILFNNTVWKTITGQKDTTLKFVVPYQLTTIDNTVALRVTPFTFTSDKHFTLLPPLLNGIEPSSGTWKSIITLYGRFNTLPAMNTITIGGFTSKVWVTTRDSLKVEVPSSLTNFANPVVYKAGPFTVQAQDSFKLTGPQIKYFTPTSGYAGQTVKIGGKYFKSGVTTVKIGQTNASIISVNDTVISCYVVPNETGNQKITVTVGQSSVASSAYFNVTNQRITSVTPAYVNYGDTIYVVGDNFRTGLKWFVGVYSVSPVSQTSKLAKIIAPYTLDYNPTKIKAVYENFNGNSTNISTDNINLNDFTVTSITPLSGRAGDIIEVTGNNFNPASDLISVSFGSVAGIRVSNSLTSIRVRVPGLSAGEHEITVTSRGRSKVYPDKYILSGPWTRLTDLPFNYDYACVFDFGEEVYVATANTSAYDRSIYHFNLASRQFEQVPGSYVSSIQDPIACTMNGLGYVLGQKGGSLFSIGFEVFNPDSLTWRTLPQYPGTISSNTFLFSGDSVIYAGCGRYAKTWSSNFYKDFWKYSPRTGKWTRLADCPYYSFFYNQVTISGRIYVASHAGLGFTRYLLEYLPGSNTWQTLASGDNMDFILGARVNVVNNGKWYLGFGDCWAIHTSYESSDPDINNRFYRYDPETNTWTTLSYPAVSARTFPMAFSAGGYVFIGGSQYTHVKDFWMYDPSKE